ncbi:hypothetical protein QYM36_009192 [Artemia franciscana]|uniref:Uncharacterized protein n=1 Tax=Artemia franciscana TaxID=6661 RepID=A0AA88HYL0_ARTSF|nr:hypothetical protein QYM36_009192 [Artemia franciscana]
MKLKMVKIVMKHNVSQLHGKSFKPPKHMCPEGSPFIFSKYRPASLAKMDVKIENSEEWQINNADIPGYVKRNRFTIAIIAMGAARHGSSAAAEEFKDYNLCLGTAIIS